MGVYDTYKMDPEMEAKGVPYFISDTETIFVARAGGSNKAYLKCLERLSRPHRRAIDKGLISNEVMSKILMQAYAETVVKGWENITDENDEPMEFSIENCIKLFTDLPELWEDVLKISTSAELYRFQAREEEAGN